MRTALVIAGAVLIVAVLLNLLRVRRGALTVIPKVILAAIMAGALVVVFRPIFKGLCVLRRQYVPVPSDTTLFVAVSTDAQRGEVAPAAVVPYNPAE